MIEIYAFDDNRHKFNIYYKDKKMEDFSFYLQSDVLTKKIKELSNWKYVDRKQLHKATKAICKNVDTGKQIQLTSGELKSLINAIIKAKKASMDTACPFNISFELILDNGELIHMIWAGDSCGIIGIEGSAYDMDNSYVNQLRDMLNNKTMLRSK